MSNVKVRPLAYAQSFFPDQRLWFTILGHWQVALEEEMSWGTFPCRRFWMSRNLYTSRHPVLRAQILARVSAGRDPQQWFAAPEADQRDDRGDREEGWSTGSSALILRKSFGQVVSSILVVLSRLLTCLADPPIRRICASPLLLIAIRFRRVLRVSDSNSLFGFLPRPSPASPTEKGERRSGEPLFQLFS